MVISTKTSERGFSLIELVVVVALVLIVTTATIGLLASLSKRALPDINRDLAAMTAQNVLVRARSAASYFPKEGDPAGSALVTQFAASQDKSFILNPNSTTFTVSARLPASTCGVDKGAITSIQLGVTTVLTGNTFDVKVTYPIVACSANAGTGTVELSEVLPLSAYIPGTRVYQTLNREPTEQ